MKDRKQKKLDSYRWSVYQKLYEEEVIVMMILVGVGAQKRERQEKARSVTKPHENAYTIIAAVNECNVAVVKLSEKL